VFGGPDGTALWAVSFSAFRRLTLAVCMIGS
jgi:hypothetical protein